MTVAELKRILSEYDDDMMVCVSGYESGYNDLLGELIVPKEVALNAHGTQWYDGRHQDPGYNHGDGGHKGIATVLVLVGH